MVHQFQHTYVNENLPAVTGTGLNLLISNASRIEIRGRLEGIDERLDTSKESEEFTAEFMTLERHKQILINMTRAS